MNGIALITKAKITSDKVSNLLIQDFQFSKKLSQNDEHELFIGKIPHNFYIVFDDSLALNDPNCIFDQETRKLIPFKEGVFNYLYFHDTNIAKYVVKIISKEYPELIIFDDDEFVGSAADYIDSY